MNMTPIEIFIIGGGRSIKEGLDLGLKEKLQGKLTIALNKSIEIFPDSTFLSYVDIVTFYKKYLTDIAKYPLVIGKYFKTDTEKLPNTTLLKTVETYDRSLKTGVYGGYLAGLFALTLAIYFINEGNIYLLGFDGGLLQPKTDELTVKATINGKLIDVPVEDVTDKIKLINEQSRQKCLIPFDGRYYRILSHFYQGQVEHRGIGKIEFYTKNDKVNKIFSPFKSETKCKIWNVSPQSNLNVFSKIDYPTMFAQMNNVGYNQEELRQWVIKRIGEINA